MNRDHKWVFIGAELLVTHERKKFPSGAWACEYCATMVSPPLNEAPEWSKPCKAIEIAKSNAGFYDNLHRLGEKS